VYFAGVHNFTLALQWQYTVAKGFKCVYVAHIVNSTEDEAGW